VGLICKLRILLGIQQENYYIKSPPHGATLYIRNEKVMFYTIKEDISDELVEKKSKFIADLFVIQNLQQADAKIKEIKKKYYDAKHHCFAYITFDDDGKKIERCSDDGEPSRNCRSTNVRAIKGKISF